MRARAVRGGVVAAVVALAVACSSGPKVLPADSPNDTARAPGSTPPAADDIDWARVWFQPGDGTWNEDGTPPTVIATDEPKGRDELVGVAGDYDGDGRWEPAVVRRVGRQWTSSWVTHGSAGTITFAPPDLPVGHTLDQDYKTLPVPGEYDGRGRTLPAWYRNFDGMWFIQGHDPVQFGSGPTTPGPEDGAGTAPRDPVPTQDQDVPVPADYDGDGTTDLAVYSPRTGRWRIKSTKEGTELTIMLGGPNEVPVPADYGGVGLAQVAVFNISGAHVGRWTVVDSPPVQLADRGEFLLPVAAVDGVPPDVEMSYLPLASDATWHFRSGETIRVAGSSAPVPAQASPALVADFPRLSLLGANVCGRRPPHTC